MGIRAGQEATRWLAVLAPLALTGCGALLGIGDLDGGGAGDEGGADASLDGSTDGEAEGQDAASEHAPPDAHAGGDATSGDAQAMDAKVGDASGDGGLVGNCTDPQDESVEAQSSFPVSVFSCAEQNLNGEPGTLNCIEGLGLTPKCAQCFDAFSHCTEAHCLSPCASGPTSAACKSCESQYCAPALSTCTGFP